MLQRMQLSLKRLRRCSVRCLSYLTTMGRPHGIDWWCPRDHQCSYVSSAAPEWSSVLLHLNALIGERLAAELSRLTSAPSIVFSEYDQTDHWVRVDFIRRIGLQYPVPGQTAGGHHIR